MINLFVLNINLHWITFNLTNTFEISQNNTNEIK